jgi:post-segregation antitoxin (ccd killing protein)
MQIKKQRTTLTLPSDSFAKAKRIARARGVTLSAVVSEALSEGLRLHAATERSEDGMIAATALVAKMPLIHNNAADFEPIRSAVEQSPERFPGLGPLELIRCASLVQNAGF